MSIRLFIAQLAAGVGAVATIALGLTISGLDPQDASEVRTWLYGYITGSLAVYLVQRRLRG